MKLRARFHRPPDQFFESFAIFHTCQHVWYVWKLAKKLNNIGKFGARSRPVFEYFFSQSSQKENHFVFCLLVKREGDLAKKKSFRGGGGQPELKHVSFFLFLFCTFPLASFSIVIFPLYFRFFLCLNFLKVIAK